MAAFDVARCRFWYLMNCPPTLLKNGFYIKLSWQQNPSNRFSGHKAKLQKSAVGDIHTLALGCHACLIFGHPLWWHHVSLQLQKHSQKVFYLPSHRRHHKTDCCIKVWLFTSKKCSWSKSLVSANGTNTGFLTLRCFSAAVPKIVQRTKYQLHEHAQQPPKLASNFNWDTMGHPTLSSHVKSFMLISSK